MSFLFCFVGVPIEFYPSLLIMDIAVIIAITVIAITYVLVRYCRNSVKRISKPINIHVSDVRFDSIQLEWTRPMQGGNHVTSYKIFCRSFLI